MVILPMVSVILPIVPEMLTVSILPLVVIIPQPLQTQAVVIPLVIIIVPIVPVMLTTTIPQLVSAILVLTCLVKIWGQLSPSISP